MSDARTPPRDHNAPPPPAPLDTDQIRAWLQHEFTTLRERVAEIAAGLDAEVKRVPTIDTDEQLGAFADNMRMAKAVTRTAGDRRTEAKAPFLEGGREIDAWFRDLLAPLDAPLKAVQRAMDDYQTRVAAEKRRQAQETARIAREAAERAAAEAARLAFADEADGTDAEQVTEALVKAERAVDRSERADARVNRSAADLVRSHSDLGTVSTARENFEFELTDERQVPRQFLVVDHALLRAWLREQTKTTEGKAALRAALDRDEQPIAGVRVFVKTTALVR